MGCLGPLAISAILDTDGCNPDYRFALLVTVPTSYMASSLLFAGTGVLIQRRFDTVKIPRNPTEALTLHDELAKQTEQIEKETDFETNHDL